MSRDDEAYHLLQAGVELQRKQQEIIQAQRAEEKRLQIEFEIRDLIHNPNKQRVGQYQNGPNSYSPNQQFRTSAEGVPQQKYQQYQQQQPDYSRNQYQSQQQYPPNQYEGVRYGQQQPQQTHYPQQQSDLIQNYPPIRQPPQVFSIISVQISC